MENLIISFNVVLPLFFAMALGYTLKRFGMYDPVRIPLKAGSGIILLQLLPYGPAPALIGKCRLGIQISMFLLLQKLPNCHGNRPLYIENMGHTTGNARYSWPVSIPSRVAADISVSRSRKGWAWASGMRISRSTSAPNSVLRMIPPNAATSSLTRS